MSAKFQAFGSVSEGHEVRFGSSGRNTTTCDYRVLVKVPLRARQSGNRDGGMNFTVMEWNDQLGFGLNLANFEHLICVFEVRFADAMDSRALQLV
ncbi:unnamed protein product [Sphenostylis stenocarpa]|uniref:Uncharacterized protein n=1 Tax=Sphenostylis stenocarpa TaxID=92480 RepID=A0AA86T938_9FABA|nr:unnamed protein product [Sphenostylis stenocarpa]